MTRLTQTTAGRRVALLLLSGVFVATATILVAYNAFAPAGSVELAVGQVATADIIAPHSITYDSEVLTSQARQSASDAIREIYDPPNPAVARQQTQLARHVLDYVDNVRHDSLATPVQQKADLTAISAIPVDVELAGQILTLSDDAWKDVDSQVMTTLDTVMRNPVREDGLPEIYASLPNIVGLTVDEARTALITGLVKSFIKPNTFYNDESTKEARKQAAATVPTEQRSFAQGQIVVRGGSIVTEADLEALTQLKLVNAPDRRLQVFVGALLFVVILGALGALYLRQLHMELFHNLSVMILIGALFLVFLAGARILETGADFQSHIYPAAAFSLIVVVLAGPQAAIVLTAALAATIGLITGNSLEFALLAAFGGSAGVLSLYRIERLNAYFRAGLVIGVVNVGIGLLSVLLQGNVDPARVVVLILAGVLNGVFCAGLAIVGLYLVSSVLNMPTSVRLIELSQPNQPLLQRLLREAPGTYQHCLQVANLGELAAERVGANASLVRVMALYHDIGKTLYPHFFVENQAEGVNPHDALKDPFRSAQIIISHVKEGERLARKYRLPAAFIDGILQHHGTMAVLYFYNEAIRAANGDKARVNRAAFCYPGPCPQSREIAILMLADSSESIVRAKKPANRQEIEAIVQEIIDFRIAEGQLDESQLTVRDLKVIREVFVSTLQGVFHPRIVYPALTETEPPKAAETPAAIPVAATTARGEVHP